MTATNHALTGAVIGILVDQPLIAIPAAVASHFVCDALPHFKVDVPEKKLLKSRGFRNYLIAEAVLCGLIVLGLVLFHPQHWLLASFCAFAAASPDLLSINRYLTIKGGKHWKGSLITNFAVKIQWFERPIGAVVEVAWFIAALVVLVPFLR